MPAYNTLVLPAYERCPRCDWVIRRRVQFKYGDTWQYDYMVGDHISWGGNDVGEPAARVSVLAYPEDCPVCGYEFPGVFDVLIRDDVIESVGPGTTEPYVQADHSSYIVLAN